MQKFFQRLWQWFQQVLAPLIGMGASPRQRGGNLTTTAPLSDTDYEFLFTQLLEGIAHGWHEGRILKFFHQLEDRSRPKDWVSWLDRFEETVLQSSSPNLTLAARMMRLGELAQSFPQIAPIGDKAYRIGRELYARQAPPQDDGIWEYDGPDAVPHVDITESLADGGTQTESYGLEELADRLKVDPALAAHFAKDLGLDNADPDLIMQTLMGQINQAQADLETMAPPETAQDWFDRGLKQAQIGELEAAIASWDAAIALEPTMAPAWHNRGSALGNMGRLEEALINFQEAAIHNPNDAYIWFNQGMVLEALDRPMLAIPSYEKALTLNPDFAEAQGRIHHLQALPTE
ncbi:MAG: tetratricopeptide repeat protein [Synechocystis sp.]|nr:tetratricopeptide repeat protein [Synechocystis sp.]